MEWLQLLLDDRALVRDVAATLLVALALILVRAAVLRALKRINWARKEDRLRWRAQLRGATFVLFATSLFLIWGSELRTFALSLVAFAVALVIATKELITCLMGSGFRLATRAFTIGDRVSIGEARGDVTDMGLFSTHLLEVGPSYQHTGRVTTVPNSALLSSNLVNESEAGDYVMHLIRVPLDIDADWRCAEATLLSAADDAIVAYGDEARVSLEALSSREGWDRPSAPGESRGRPSVALRFDTPKQIELLLRVPAPSRIKGRIEQTILRTFLDAYTAREERTAR